MLNDALMAERNRKEFSLKPETVLRFLDSFIGDINNPDTRRKLLDGLVENIYVYPDKLAVACFYSDDRRELPFEETIKLIEDSKSFRSPIFDPDFVPTEASRTMLESLLEDMEGEGGDEILDETEEASCYLR